MKRDIKNLFTEIQSCMNVCEIIIDHKNIALTFDGYISTNDIDRLQKTLGIDHFIVTKHNYNRMKIVFTYNSELHD